LCHTEIVNEQTPHYRWPWLVLAFFLLACALAVVWMTAEVKRTQRIRDFNYQPSPSISTNR
jgi:hypothetical protein